MTLPTSNVTFLFTDIEGSSRLWESNLVAMGPALALPVVAEPRSRDSKPSAR